jgi:hypothetical protein
MENDMAETKGKTRCVAGRVKVRYNKDGSATFIVAGKEGKRFTLAQASKHAQSLLLWPRALVVYEEGERNPRILVVFPNPTNLLIHQYMAAANAH